MTTERTQEAHLSTALATFTSGASVAAAAAPALCAVHCAAMPFAAVLLPSLQQVGGGKLGGMCMHAVGRKIAFYFVVPCGLLSNAIGYPQHQSLAVTGASLTGVSLMTAAAALRALSMASSSSACRARAARPQCRRRGKPASGAAAERRATSEPRVPACARALVRS